MTNENSTYKGLKETQESLPASFYLDPAHYERELQAIWYRNWVYVCRADTLHEARAFRTIAIGTQSILVLRDEHGDLQAFHNTCRHRGSVLCTENEGRLRSKSITCPYHSWSYSLQGELKRTTSKNCPAGFDKQNFPLYKVAVDEWNGFVFVNLDGENAVPLQDSFQQDSANLDNWPLSSLKLGHSYRKTMACNWKIFWENFNECLHCPNIHPELCKVVPIYSRAYMEPEEDPNWPDNKDSTDPKITGGMHEDAETWSFDGKTVGKTFENLTEEQRKAGYHYVVNQPTVFIAAHVDYVRLVRLLPLGPEKTELHIEWLFSEETLADKSFDIEKAAGFAKLVMQQDAFVSELNQKGLHCIQHKQGVLMAEEYDVHNFQNWVRDQLSP
jgi:Rieske 2Fe-2S family protein